MHKTIRIATLGVADDYQESLIPQIIRHFGYQIDWTTPKEAQVIIFGPFYNKKKKNWIPKPLRPLLKGIPSNKEKIFGDKITIFQTGENIRHDYIEAEFGISFDLSIDSQNHLRHPYWFEALDWSHEGIHGNHNPRFGSLLNIQKLRSPLGTKFLKKPFKAAMFTSHLREPRKTLLRALKNIILVEGYGPYFNPNIKHHNTSNITKKDILEKYAFNLCPENGMYPGYYTEKIPESFMADSLPITWADSNISVDFNPSAFINLAPMTANNFYELREILESQAKLNEYADQPLLVDIPTLNRHKEFIKEILTQALS